ncbi:MAG: hypothetical protein Phog2KO_29160 [Phototrophicaceae bacterium]
MTRTNDMQNMTSEYRDILPNNQFEYVEGGMQLYLYPNHDAISSIVQGLSISIEDVMTFNSALDRTYALIPTANEGYQWLIHGEYSASLEATEDIVWSDVEAPDGSTVSPPELGADERITHFDESQFTYVIYNSTTGSYRTETVWSPPEMDDNFWDNEQEVLLDQNYTIRTTDDVLRRLWVQQCVGNPEEYTRVAGEACFRGYFANAISDALNNWAYSGRDSLMAIPNIGIVVDQGALDSWESASQSSNDMLTLGVLGLILNQEVITERIGNLSLEAITELYTALLSPTHEVFGDDAVHLQDEQSYVEALDIAITWETGGIGDTSDFVPDLATGDWLEENPDYGAFNSLFSRITELIQQAALIGIFFDRFNYPITVENVLQGITLEDFWDANSILEQYLQGFDEFTYDDLVSLSLELSEEFSTKSAALTFTSDDAILNNQFEMELENANTIASELSTYGEGYEDRIALDNLRAVIFDPAWNPTTQLAQLGTLNSVIAEMPTSILGVDVSFAQAGMQEYHDLLLQQLEWHLQMQKHMTNVDTELLRRQEDGIPWQTLWWLGEFALAFLFEPLDWLITIRDIGMGIIHGNLSAWDFLGFLPILTNRLGDIAQLMARSDVDELVEEGATYTRHINNRQGLRTGARPGVAATEESIRTGEVVMELHPDYAQLLQELEEQGFSLEFFEPNLLPNGTYPNVRVILGYIYNSPKGNRQLIDELRRIYVVRGMRYLDLEHEVDHVRQLTNSNYLNNQYAVHAYFQRGNGSLKEMGNIDDLPVIRLWQNHIMEYHVRLREFIRLDTNNASRDLIEEHALGLNEARAEYYRAINRNGDRSGWAQSHFNEIGNLQNQVYGEIYPSYNLSYSPNFR